MGNCCGSQAASSDVDENFKPASGAFRKSSQWKHQVEKAEGSTSENGGLNSFLQSRSRSSMQRQVSQALSAASWRTAQSHFDDEPSFVESPRPSFGGDAPSEHHGTRQFSSGGSVPESPYGPGSPGSLSVPGLDRRGSDVEAEWTQQRRSMTSRVSMTFSRIGSRSSQTPVRPEMSDHEREASPYRVDVEGFDAAMVAVHNKLYGRSVRLLSESRPLPPAPWNAGKPGYLGSLTAEQQAALSTLQVAFPDWGSFCTVHDLLRFLRARNFDVKATEALFWKYCHVYRGRLMVSPAPPVRPTYGSTWQMQLLDSFPPRPGACTLQFQRAMRCFLHAMVFRQDRIGRPVIYLRVADIVKNCMGDYLKLAERLAMQSAANETNRLLCMMASAQAGYHIEEVFQVMDVGHVSTIAMLKYVRSTENQAEFEFNSTYAPESIGKVFIVNGPYGGNQVWKLAQVFIPPATREKISICSNDYRATLAKHIHPDDIPTCYGGNAPMEWPKHELPTAVFG